MLVTASGLDTGTVGGGRVEHQAIQYAQAMLAASPEQAAPDGPCPPPPASCILLEWNLKRDVGMTCGGSVKLFFETYNHSDWRIVVFGAGHVASAVVDCLGRLDCHVTCIDPRAEWLDRIPSRNRLRRIQSDQPRTLVADLPDDAFVICMTMGHATDRPILEEIFRQGRQFPFLGVIGSKAKRAVLHKELVAAGIPADKADAFRLPHRPGSRHQPTRRNRDQRRGPVDPRARSLAQRRTVILSAAKDLRCLPPPRRFFASLRMTTSFGPPYAIAGTSNCRRYSRCK